MEQINKNLMNVKEFIDSNEIEGKVKSCLENASQNLKDANNIIDKTKKVQKDLESVDIGAIFQDELGNLNELVFDNFMEINDAMEKLSEKHFPKGNEEVDVFLQESKSRVSKVQKAIGKITKMMKEKFIKLEDLQNVNGVMFPKLNDSIGDLIDKLKDLLKNLELKFKEMARSLDEAETQLGSLQAEIERLTKENEALKGKAGEAGTLVTRVSELEKANAEKDTSIATLSGQNETLKEQADQVGPLQAKVAELDASNSEHIATIASLKGQVNALKGQAGDVGTLQAKVAELEGARAEKDLTITKLTNENDELKGRADKLDAVQARLAEIEGSIAEKDVTMTKLTSENDALKGQAGQAGELAAKVSELEAKITGLEGRVSEKEASIASLTQENQALQGQAGEVGTLASRISELERALGEKDTSIAGKDASIATLNEENQALKTQASDAATLTARVAELERIIAEREGSMAALTNENETLKEQSGQVAPLQAKVTELDTTVSERDSSITTLTSEIAGLKKQLDECTSSSAADAELQKKLEKIEREMKYLLKFLEKSPKHQLLYIISDLETTDLVKVKEMTNFDEGLIRRVLDELQAEDLVICSPVQGEPTNMTIRAIGKLNPIAYLEVNPASVPDAETFSSHNYEATFDKSLLRLQKIAETDPETAGYLASRLMVQVHKKRDYQRVSRLNDVLGKLKNASFYTRLVDNIFAKSYEEKRNEAILNGAIDMPDLSVLDTDYNEVNEGDPLAQHPPFKVITLSKMAVTEEGESIAVPDSEHHEFPSIQAMARWAWLTSKGKKIKVEYKDGKDRKLAIVVSMTGPRYAELVKKTFQERMN